MKEILIDTVTQAGKFLLSKFRNPEFTQIAVAKGRFDYSIKMDQMTEKLIIDNLKKNGVEAKIITEEAGEVGLGESEYTFYIDPLDGTFNYAHGIPHYAVSVGIERNNELSMGAVYDPNNGELFFAENGKGAFLNEKRINVSKTSELRYSVMNLFGRTLKENPETAESQINLMKNTYVRMPMSAVLALAYTACGRTDATVGSGHRKWDIAAGSLLVKEAGGIVTEINGNEFSLESKSIVASNPAIHKHIIEVLNSDK